MKEYGETLAKVKVLAEALEWAYNQAESHKQESERCSEVAREMEEGKGCTPYYEEEASNHAAMAKAFIQLAERLGKGVV